MKKTGYCILELAYHRPGGKLTNIQIWFWKLTKIQIWFCNIFIIMWISWWQYLKLFHFCNNREHLFKLTIFFVRKHTGNSFLPSYSLDGVIKGISILRNTLHKSGPRKRDSGLSLLGFLTENLLLPTWRRFLRDFAWLINGILPGGINREKLCQSYWT